MDILLDMLLDTLLESWYVSFVLHIDTVQICAREGVDRPQKPSWDSLRQVYI